MHAFTGLEVTSCYNIARLVRSNGITIDAAPRTSLAGEGGRRGEGGRWN